MELRGNLLSRVSHRSLEMHGVFLHLRILKTISALSGFILTVVGCSGSVSGTDPDGDGGAVSGCRGGNVASMVVLPEGYSIDSTDVTRCQYQAWLDTNPSVETQDPWCVWNTSFEPTGREGLDCGFPAVAGGDLPVVCVDWCDAFAYCEGVGKRLCGRIGGGANEMEDYADAAKSQWHNACTSGGQYYYTYGDSYDYGSKCNDADHAAGELTAAGSLVTCQSPDRAYSGVFDLSGNVWEWEDSCEKQLGETDYCQMRGGSLASPEWYSSCMEESWAIREAREGNLGFRCCSD